MASIYSYHLDHTSYHVRDVRCDEDGEVVRPGEGLVGLPPPTHHQRHIETQYEGHGNQVAEASTVDHQALEYSAKKEGVTVYRMELCMCVIGYMVRGKDRVIEWVVVAGQYIFTSLDLE